MLEVYRSKGARCFSSLELRHLSFRIVLLLLEFLLVSRLVLAVSAAPNFLLDQSTPYHFPIPLNYGWQMWNKALLLGYQFTHVYQCGLNLVGIWPCFLLELFSLDRIKLSSNQHL